MPALFRLVSLVLLLYTMKPAHAQSSKPLRIGVAGLTHTHVHWIFNSAKRKDIEIVGIAEPNRELAERYARQYGFPMTKLYSTLAELIDKQKPEAMAAFNSIYEHLEVVEQCTPRGIHVMVEKPLAVNLDHARKMEALARQHNIQLLTNYETTWYNSVHTARQLIESNDSFGVIRKLVVHDGHQGPREIGVNEEFLEWLTDSVRNGAGALMDFGCYGADLSTFFMRGERPLSVTAITQQLKPEVYPKVDDEATIVLTYPSAQAIIQASWNWPVARKDMEIYCRNGYVYAPNRNLLKMRTGEKQQELTRKLAERKAPFDDPFSYFRGVVRGTITPEENDLSSLRVNVIVMEILEAAKYRPAKAEPFSLKELARHPRAVDE